MSARLNLFIISMIMCFGVNIYPMPPHPDLYDKLKREGKLSQLVQRIDTMKKRGMDKAVRTFPATGSRRVLVLLIQYSDTPMDDVSTPAFYSGLFNGGGSPTLTWKKYYQDMSNNQLNLTFDIFGPYTAITTLDYYGQNNASNNDTYPGTLVGEAIDKAELAGVDFSQYDNDGDGEVDGVVVIHAGRGEESGAADNTIWSHRWSLDSAYSNGYASSGHRSYDGVIINDYAIQPEYVRNPGDSTIGVFCHEFGHVLGLPDLYDVNSLTDGVGRWSLMAAGSWNGPNGFGSVPAPLLAWEKDYLGWLPDVQTAMINRSSDNNFGSTLEYAAVNIIGIIIIIGLIITIVFGKKFGLKGVILQILCVIAIPFAFLIVVTCPLPPLPWLDPGDPTPDPPAPTLLYDNVLKDDSLSSGEPKLYYFEAVAGNTYYVYWNDSYSGDGTKTCDIKVTAYGGDTSTHYFTGEDSAYSYPISITATATERVYLRVEIWDIVSSGTFSIKYYSSGSSSSSNSSNSSLSSSSLSLEDIETSHKAIKVSTNYSYNGYDQYYLIENKVKTDGTWTQYLPGDGLLVVLVDNYVLNGVPYSSPIGTLYLNLVNSLYLTVGTKPWCHGITIIEADGDSELWTHGSFAGESTDTFKDMSSYAYLYRNNYTGSTTGTKLSTASGVALTNVSATGSTMTFDLAR